MRCRAERQWIQQSRGILRKVIPSAVEGSRLGTCKRNLPKFSVRELLDAHRDPSTALGMTCVKRDSYSRHQTVFLYRPAATMRSLQFVLFCALFFFCARGGRAESALIESKP